MGCDLCNDISRLIPRVPLGSAKETLVTIAASSLVPFFSPRGAIFVGTVRGSSMGPRRWAAGCYEDEGLVLV